MELKKAKELAEHIRKDGRVKRSEVPRYTHIVFAPAEYHENPFLYFEKIKFPTNLASDFSFEIIPPVDIEGDLIPYVVTTKQTLAEALEDFLKEIKLFSEYKHYFH